MNTVRAAAVPWTSASFGHGNLDIQLPEICTHHHTKIKVGSPLSSCGKVPMNMVPTPTSLDKGTACTQHMEMGTVVLVQARVLLSL